jgi:hypothetical protein
MMNKILGALEFVSLRLVAHSQGSITNAQKIIVNSLKTVGWAEQHTCRYLIITVLAVQDDGPLNRSH